MINDDQFSAGQIGYTRSEGEKLRALRSQAAKNEIERAPTLQDVTQRLRCLLGEARRNEEVSEEILARMTGRDSHEPPNSESDAPSNGFIEDTLDLCSAILAAVERSNGNLTSLRNAVMLHGITEAAE